MDNICIKQNKETFRMTFTFSQAEKAFLSQIARLLVSEKWITPEEQIRFLALLKEGD